MNESSVPLPPRDDAQVAAEDVGRVVHAMTGLLLVSSGGRTVRATYGADLLALVARDPDEAPRVGDRVRLRTWADGPVTVERVLVRAVPEEGPAT